MALDWRWTRFAGLGVDGVYDMLALRARAFVLEQGAFVDPDGVDRQAWHLLGRDGDGALRAYLRIVDPGVKYDEPSIGRVAIEKPLRGRGAGHALVEHGVARCTAEWPGQGIRISAQAHLQRFYQRHGFVTIGDVYLEDDIAHVQMWRSPR